MRQNCVVMRLFFLFCLVLATGTVAAQEYVAGYGLQARSKELEVGLQPLGYPNGVIGAILRRDRVLRAQLEAVGNPLKSFAFRRGADMVAPLAEARLDAGLIGDMPTTLAASTGSVWVVGLVKVAQTAIVTHGGGSLADLAGKRIGYVPLSTAHSTLVRGLATVRLGATDVTLVPMANADLAAALARQEIDAFAGWEPASSIALAANSKNRIVFKGQSVDYFVLGRQFEQASPEAARLLVAGFVRAFEWLRRNPRHIDTAAQWAIDDGQAFSGQPIGVSVAQVAAITRSDILNVPSAPVMVVTPATTPLKPEFELLKSLDQLPPKALWANVTLAFTYGGLRQVMLEPRKYEIRTFDYEN
jgi:sulfonate transport system substrate-binding protein